jgi:hypothetical protein
MANYRRQKKIGVRVPGLRINSKRVKYQINNGDSWSTISKEQYEKCCEIFDCRIVNDWATGEPPESSTGGTTTDPQPLSPTVDVEREGIEKAAELYSYAHCANIPRYLVDYPEFIKGIPLEKEDIEWGKAKLKAIGIDPL